MEEKRTPGMQLLMLLAITFCCMFLGQAVARIVLLSFYEEIPAHENEVDPLIRITTAGIYNVFAHVLAFFVFLRAAGFKFYELIPRTKMKVGLFALIPVIAVCALMLQVGLSDLSVGFFEWGGFYEVIELNRLYESMMTPILFHNNPLQLVVSLIALAVIPAFGEELFYRGILQTKLNEATHNIHFSVVITAFIFAAMHWQPMNLITIAVMGILLGYVYALTKNIWYSILLHFLINGVQIAFAYYWPEMNL